MKKFFRRWPVTTGIALIAALATLQASLMWIADHLGCSPLWGAAPTLMLTVWLAVAADRKLRALMREGDTK